MLRQWIKFRENSTFARVLTKRPASFVTGRAAAMIDVASILLLSALLAHCLHGGRCLDSASIWVLLLSRVTDHLLIGLANHEVEHFALGPGCVVLEDFQKPIAALGADTLHCWIVRALRHTDRCAIVIVADAHTLQVLCVENVVLVSSTTACLGLAERALLSGAGASVCLGIDNGEIAVAATFWIWNRRCTARGARGWARDDRVRCQARGLPSPLDSLLWDFALFVFISALPG